MSVRVGRRPLSVAAAYRELERPGVGGVVLFVGCVRPDRLRDGTVRSLLYEAHEPLARVALERLEGSARRRSPRGRFVLWHRLGTLPIGEASVLVGAATPHRAEAFTLARWLIDRLKVEAPIWKSSRGPRGRPLGERRHTPARTR